MGIHESIQKIKDNLLPEGRSLYWHDKEIIRDIEKLISALEELKPYEEELHDHKKMHFFEWLEDFLLKVERDYDTNKTDELKKYLSDQLDLALLKVAHWFEGVEKLESKRKVFLKSYNLPDLVYSIVFSFLEKQHLVQEILEYLRLSEEEAYEKLGASKTGLAILDAVRCAMDKKRTLCFLKAVMEATELGGVVLEAGSGTGVLSIMAAVCGARKVYALEINPRNIKLSKQTIEFFERNEFIREHLHLGRELAKFFVKEKLIRDEIIDVIHTDSIKYEPREKIDLLISENLYTGFFFEYQQQIINHLLKFLKSGGKVIPLEMESSVELANTNLGPTKDMSIIVKDIAQENQFVLLSNTVRYDKTSFKLERPLLIKKTIKIPIIKKGYVNCVIISSKVKVNSKMILDRNETDFLVNDTLVLLVGGFDVSKGEEKVIQISYMKSGHPRDLKISVAKGVYPRFNKI